MNLYEQLGMEQTASQQEIKRAYFRLVREFTPEKYPKEFMQIRQAYETLSDPAQRTAYDAILARFTGISKEVTAVIIEAERLGEKGLWADAVDLLEQSQYSAKCHMQSALCSLYLELGKSGKATKIAEKLAADHPDNADYLRLKAKTYMERGWTNKASEIRRSLEQLDPGNEDNTSALLFDETKQHPLHLGRMVERVEEKNGKAPLLCAHILSNCFNAEKNGVDYIQQQLLFNLMGGEKQPWSDPLLAAKKLAEHSYGISADKGEKVRTLLEDNILKAIFFEDCYSILPDINQIIQNIGAKDLCQNPDYRIISAGYEAQKAVEAGIPKTIAALPLMCVWVQACTYGENLLTGFQNEILLLELEILENILPLLPHIRRFEEEFSEFSKFAADFFEMAVRSGQHKIDNEINRRIPRAMKLKTRLVLSWLGEDDDFANFKMSEEPREPVQVTRIGRNEPCPCGSGKKYKKCCGQ